ncbi:unnamed protein product [Penicillium discolor]
MSSPGRTCHTQQVPYMDPIVRKRTLIVMSSPDSDGHHGIIVGLDDVRDSNLDNILPLPPADIVKIGKWAPRPVPGSLQAILRSGCGYQLA